MDQLTKPDFSAQHFFIGIDVHKKQWTVVIQLEDLFLKNFSMNPSPTELARKLKKDYPQGTFHSVYEAGFSGFWIHRELTRLGIDNIVIHPADVPTTHKQRQNKSDKVDARKLAKHLHDGSLLPIFIPTEAQQQLRSLSRIRQMLVKEQTRTKNRIKSFLTLNGIHIPEEFVSQHWSKPFIQWIKDLRFSYPAAGEVRDTLITQLLQTRENQLINTRQLRAHTRSDEICKIFSLLKTIPGIGFKSAVTLYCEIIDINRFSREDQLFSYFGLTPCITSSDQTQINRGITKRKNPFLRHIIIECAWIAVRKDPALTEAFCKLKRRMLPQKAIIRMARKLVSRIRAVWKNQRPYVMGVIK